MIVKRVHKIRFTITLGIGLLMFQSLSAQKETESVEKYRAVYNYQQPATNGNQQNNVQVVNYQPISRDSFGVFYAFDKQLEHLLELHKSQNARTTEGPGFRIQIYAGGKMELANEAKTDFLQSFSQTDISVYQNWQPPHFRVRVGDFLSRQEAMRQLSTIRKVFPDAFVVSDKINLPKYKKLQSSSGLGQSESDKQPD